MNIFCMSDITDTPVHSQLVDELRSGSILVALLKEHLIDKLVFLSWPSTISKSSDHIKSYASEIISLGLFYKEYLDAVCEGDGICILQCWHYMMLIFKASNKVKYYSVEAFTMLAQYHFLFSKRMAQQLIWSRAINMHGKSVQ